MSIDSPGAPRGDTPAGAPDLQDRLQAQLEDLFWQAHEQPELAWEEHATTRRIEEYLRARGIETVETGLPTGVIALIRGAAPHAGQAPRRIALRADLDGLPLTEATGLPRAAHTGTQHACGHDYHQTALLGAADLLQRHRDTLPGDVVLVFQPAEEDKDGARRVVATGVLQLLGIEAFLALHVTPLLAPGVVAVSPGVDSAAVDKFRVTLRGQGGHAASPHLARDVVVGAAHLIVALQSIVSRSVDPFAPAVVSVTSVHAGTTWNVLPETATITGTTRTFGEDVRALVRERFATITEGEARAFGLGADVEWVSGCPSVVTDARLAGVIARAADDLGIPQGIVRPGAGGEDFSEYRALAPTGFFRIGVGGDAAPHTSRFAADPSTLSRTAALWLRVARRYFADDPLRSDS